MDVSKVAPGMKNVSSPLDGVATAGQPTEAELRGLAAAGCQTVVDLRTSGEDRGFAEAEAVRGAGMEYVNIPVEADPGSFDDEDFDRFRGLMTNRERRPMLVHCGTATRVGVLMLPYLILDEGRNPEKAMEMVRGVGPEKEQLTARALEYVDARKKA